MVGLWPSANPCTTWSSWTHVSVASWFFWCVGSSFSGCSDSYSVEVTDLLYWHWNSTFLLWTGSDYQGGLLTPSSITSACMWSLLFWVCFPSLESSYSQIVSSLMRMFSAAGKHKTFSTCGSHLFVVSLYYGTRLGVYFSSDMTHFPQKSSIAFVLYTVVTTMLNPFI